MKIFIVCNNLGCGGAERVGVNLANGFANKSHRVFIITDIHQKANYPVEKKVMVLPFSKQNKGKISKWYKATQNIRKYAKQEKPDVIIGIMEVCTLVSFIATLGMRIHLIMTEHNSFERPKSTPLSLKEKIFKFWINKLYKNITVLTEADNLHIGTRLKNITVMPNPLFLTPIDNLPKKENIVLAAGRVDDWHFKGFDVLLQAWKSLYYDNENLRDWWLKIAGAGKQESFEYLMNLLPDGEWVYNDNVNDDDNHINTKYTKEKNTSTEKQNSQKGGAWSSEKYHIEFLGFQKDMESLYKKSEIFVLSSRYEGFGLVLIEAMSQGCAPIACDYKGRQKEILCPEGVSCSKSQDSSLEICENGILCEPDNVEALTKAMEKMIEDEIYRKIVQKNAIERSKFYDMEHTIDRWEKYLKEITTNNI
jgi:glycosyltransferase involved in cell wall biosynthesis